MAEPPPSDDPLDQIRERIRATQEAAERLVADAAASFGDGASRTPPMGWDVPREQSAGGRAAGELQALVALLELVRGLIPRELQQQFLELVRELLVLVRALVDWWLERLDRERGREVEIEDIPIS